MCVQRPLKLVEITLLKNIACIMLYTKWACMVLALLLLCDGNMPPDSLVGNCFRVKK